MNNPPATSAGNKILWLSIIQGYAILLVVIGHVNGFTYRSEGEMYPLAEFIHRLCYSFHMPLFMFVSGGLLYMTRINKGWSTTALYRDKAKRLLLPFIAFTVVGFVIKLVFARWAKTPTDFSAIGFLNAFFNPADGPLKEMWFVATLLWLMACYPIYKTMLKNGLTELLLLGVSLVPFLTGVHLEIPGWFNISGVSKFAFYFIAGILFFKYNVAGIFERSRMAVAASCAAFAVLFILDFPALGFLTATAGILMTFGLGIRIARLHPNLFSSFRDHSFQIFLVGIFPQLFIELLVWKRVHSEGMLVPFYAASVAAAILAGVATSKFGQKIPSKIMRWTLGLK